eukprot:1938630-Rhodomonas_salina.1
MSSADLPLVFSLPMLETSTEFAARAAASCKNTDECLFFASAALRFRGGPPSCSSSGASSVSYRGRIFLPYPGPCPPRKATTRAPCAAAWVWNGLSFRNRNAKRGGSELSPHESILIHQDCRFPSLLWSSCTEQ